MPAAVLYFTQYLAREIFMRKVPLGLAAVIAFAVIFLAGTANADPYKWCAVYSARGSSNCGFVTLEQCRATVSGIGGFCSVNQFYTGPEERPRKRQRG
jgi:hypothetical protein